MHSLITIERQILYLIPNTPSTFDGNGSSLLFLLLGDPDPDTDFRLLGGETLCSGGRDGDELLLLLVLDLLLFPVDTLVGLGEREEVLLDRHRILWRPRSLDRGVRERERDPLIPGEGVIAIFETRNVLRM